MRWLFALMVACAAHVAHAGTYVLQCKAQCVASDGTTRPAGTFLAPTVDWDGVTPFAPPGMNVVPFTGQTLYRPAAPPPDPPEDHSRATVTATGSPTARTLASRAADEINVRDFGAKGDGVTDDAAGAGYAAPPAVTIEASPTCVQCTAFATSAVASVLALTAGRIDLNGSVVVQGAANCPAGSINPATMTVVDGIIKKC